MSARAIYSTTPAMPSAGGRAAGLLLMFLGSFVAIFLLRHEVLNDPHYWDSLGGYVAQSRFMAQHGLDLQVYKELGYVRPPLFTGVMAFIMWLGGTSLPALHLAMFGWGALILPGTFVMARCLGASRRGALLAAAFCLFSPHFVGQVGLVESDLPLAALTTIAWVLLLRGRTVAFIVMTCLAVLIKETAVFLLPPAAILLYLRAGSPRLVSLRTLGLLLPLGAPCLVLLGWLLLHKHMIGLLIIKDHVDAVSTRHMPYALFHNFLDGGRFALLIAFLIGAGYGLRRGGARTAHFFTLPVDERRKLLATFLGFVLMPIFLPTTLARYMMPTLPFLCALTAVALEWSPQRWRPAVAALLFTVLVIGWRGYLTVPDHPHREGNTTYRTLLAVHQQLASEVAAYKPRLVLGGFPTPYLLGSPPEDGYLDKPLRVRVPHGNETLAELCECDLLVQAQDPTVEPAIKMLSDRGALTLLAQLGSPTPPPPQPIDPIWDLAVRIYRIQCPPDIATTPAPAQ